MLTIPQVPFQVKKEVVFFIFYFLFFMSIRPFQGKKNSFYFYFYFSGFFYFLFLNYFIVLMLKIFFLKNKKIYYFDKFSKKNLLKIIISIISNNYLNMKSMESMSEMLSNYQQLG